MCVCVCLSVREHISGTAGPIFTKFYVQIACCHGLVVLRGRCDMLCTFGFMDDVTFGHNGLYGNVQNCNELIVEKYSAPRWSLMSMNALFVHYFQLIHITFLADLFL